jgi:hypothetical protein
MRLLLGLSEWKWWKQILMLLGLIILLLISGIFAYVLFEEQFLVIEGENGSCALPVKENDVVSVSFIHSVELSRTIDFYKIKRGYFLLFKTLTKTAGWGLPSTEKNFSTTIYDGEEWFEFGIERKIESFIISTHPINQYIIKVESKEIKYGKLVKTITLKIEKGNIFYLINRRCEVGEPE